MNNAQHSVIQLLRWFGVCAAFVLVIGCGRKVELVKVEGTVTLDGKPLEGVTVIFLPEGSTGQTARGLTQPEGAFQLFTGERMGVEPADYKVMVGIVHELTPEVRDDPGALVKQEETLKKNIKKTTIAIPEVYGKPYSTPLRCTVPPEGKVSLELKSGAR